MTDFHRTSVNDRSFIRGAARLLYQPVGSTQPTQISDVIALASSVGPPAVALYDPVGDWVDLGATKTGIQISHNNAEETFDVDQIYGDIASQPTNWEVSVATQLAEFTPERLQIAWEGSAISEANSEQSIGFGQPTAYTQRQLAVAYQRPNGKIRVYVFWKVQRTPQESTVTHAKTGEQVSVPVRFRVIADTTRVDPLDRFFRIYDQDLPV